MDGRCVDRLIGFEDLGHDDAFTSSALEFRLKQSGALPTGKILLADHISSDLFEDGEGEAKDVDDEEGRRGKGKDGGLRRGKTGIRDGFAAGQRDNDEWE